MSTFTVVVIGAGPADMPRRSTPPISACRSRSSIPAPNPGGVCLYRGCIPSKALLHVADAGQRGEARRGLGRRRSARRRSTSTRLRGFKDKVVTQLTGGVGQVAKLRKINYIQGTAAFRDARSLEITGDGRQGTPTLTFEHAIIATGSRPATVPGLSIDSPRVMDSTARARSARHPEVAAGRRRRLHRPRARAASTPRSASKVTVVEMTDGLLPGADRDLVNILAKRVETMCEAVLLNTKVVGDEGGRRRHRGHVRGQAARGHGRRSRRSTACWSRSAAGRTRAVPGPRQDRASRSTSAASSRSTRRCRPPSRRSTRSATSSASRCWRTRRRTRRASPSTRSPASKVAFEPLAIPAVVFTDPELAWCGLTESDAQKQKREVTVARFPWARVGPRDHARPHRRHDQAGHRSRRPSASSASASSGPAPAS